MRSYIPEYLKKDPPAICLEQQDTMNYFSRMHHLRIFSVIMTIVTSMHLFVFAENIDSTAYYTQREKLLSSHKDTASISAFVSASDELAAQGLYKEAAELLLELTTQPDSSQISFPEDSAQENAVEQILGPFPSVPPDEEPKIARREKSVEWRISSTSSYNSMLDRSMLYPDTIISPDDTAFFLKDIYSSEDINCRMLWRPKALWIKKIEPAVSLSYYDNYTRQNSQKANVRADIQAAFFREHFTLDGFLEGEFRYHEPYLDSSNVLKSRLQARLQDNASVFTYAMECIAGLEEYQHSRPGYLSSWEYTLNPFLCINSKDISRSVTIGMKYGNQTYDRYISDSTVSVGVIPDAPDTIKNDEVFYGPWLTLALWYSRFSCTSDGSFVWKKYPFYKERSDGLYPYTEFETDINLNLSTQPSSWFELLFIGNYLFDREFTPSYSSSPADTAFSFSKKVHLFSLEPGTVFHLPRNIQIGMTCAFERQTYSFRLPKQFKNHVNELEAMEFLKKYNAYIPGLNASYENRLFDISAACDIRIEKVQKEPSFIKEGDFWELGPSASVGIRPWQWASCDLSGFYYYHRSFDGKNNNSGVFVSLILEATF